MKRLLVVYNSHLLDLRCDISLIYRIELPRLLVLLRKTSRYFGDCFDHVINFIDRLSNIDVVVIIITKR